MIYAVIEIDRDACKAAATVERRIADGRDGVGNGDACKAGAPVERRTADGRDGVGNGDAGKIVAISERIVGNDLCSRFDDIFSGDGVFGFDQVLSNVKDAVFPIALIAVICGIVEQRTVDGSDGAADRDICKVSATVERPLADGRDGVADRDACKAGAIGERPTADGRDGIGNGDACPQPLMVVTESGMVMLVRLPQ